MSTVRLNSAELTLKHLKTTLSKGNKKEEKFHSCRGKITHRCAPTELRKKYLTKNTVWERDAGFSLTKEKTIFHSEMLYPVKLSFRNKEEVSIFSEKTEKGIPLDLL